MLITPSEKNVHDLRFRLYEMVNAAHALMDSIPDGEHEKFKSRLLETAEKASELLRAQIAEQPITEGGAG